MTITNNDIRITLNTISNKEREGLVGYNRFNNLLWIESLNYFDFHLRRYDRDWKSRHSLQPFLRESENMTSSGSVPFNVLSGTVAKIIEARSDGNKPFEIVDNEGIWYDRLDQYIKRPTTENPIVRLKNGGLEVEPKDLTTIKDIIYLKYPVKPYLDGYLDGNLNFNYLEEGGSVDLDSCSSCVTIGGDTTGAYSSQTKEMEFYDVDKVEIAARMLAALGITFNKQSLSQYLNLTEE